MVLTVRRVAALDKGKVKVSLDDGTEFVLYRGEVRQLALREGGILSEEQYDRIKNEILGKRAKKRAMHLLERQDRTEQQLYEKLKQNGYPEDCIIDALDYVKSYHYLDDLRFARTYIRYQQEKKSRQRLKMDLLAKGVKSQLIEQAMEEEYASDETEKIMQLLEKRQYTSLYQDEKEKRKIYQFLLRRGFQSNDIMRTMRVAEQEADLKRSE